MTMPHRFTGERTLMRIFIGESDKCEQGPHKGLALYEALLRLFRQRGFAGATVLRGTKGFGSSARIHTADLLRLSLDLPEVIEVIETEEKIQEILPELDRMIDGGRHVGEGAGHPVPPTRPPGERALAAPDRGAGARGGFHPVRTRRSDGPPDPGAPERSIESPWSPDP
jgi:uncharacterized protein